MSTDNTKDTRKKCWSAIKCRLAIASTCAATFSSFGLATNEPDAEARTSMTKNDEIERRVAAFQSDVRKVSETVGKRIVGQEQILEGVVTCLIAGGNVLLEGVPGLGKT